MHYLHLTTKKKQKKKNFTSSDNVFTFGQVTLIFKELDFLFPKTCVPRKCNCRYDSFPEIWSWKHPHYFCILQSKWSQQMQNTMHTKPWIEENISVGSLFFCFVCLFLFFDKETCQIHTPCRLGLEIDCKVMHVHQDSVSYLWNLLTSKTQ